MLSGLLQIPIFNHTNIIIYAERQPWLSERDGLAIADVSTMNAALIENWNSVVGPNDVVYHLGDAFYPFKTAQLHRQPQEVFAALNGHKHLILGNHDLQYPESNVDLPWESIQQYLELKVSKRVRFVLFHYPLETWRNAHHGWLHLHGHCHGTLKNVIPHRWDIGVDVPFGPSGVLYRPIAVEEILEVAATQEYVPQDHHGDR